MTCVRLPCTIRSLMAHLARMLHRHYWLSALLLGCLVLRAFVPAGYMLDTDGGDLGLKMCSGQVLAGPAETLDDSTHSPPVSEGPTGHHDACPAGVPLLALAFALTLSAEQPFVPERLPVVDGPPLSSIPPSPSRLPRGPPLLLV